MQNINMQQEVDWIDFSGEFPCKYGKHEIGAQAIFSLQYILHLAPPKMHSFTSHHTKNALYPKIILLP